MSECVLQRRPCYVMHMPPEVLSLIFEMNATDSSDGRAAISSSHVCQFWRNIALATPLLWTHIYLGSSHAKELCIRSKSLPIHLYVVSTIPLAYEWLRQHSDRIASITARGEYGTRRTRWRSASITRSKSGASHSISTLISNIGPFFPLLSRLDVQLKGDVWPMNTTALNIPHLTSLKLKRFALSPWKDIRNLTTLQLQTLNDTSEGIVSPSIEELCSILDRSPKLQILHLTGISSAVPPGPAGHHNIELTHIESFKIRTTTYIPSLLSHLHIPSSAPVFDLYRQIVADPSLTGLLPITNTKLHSHFQAIPLGHILNINEGAIWFGRQLHQSPLSFQGFSCRQGTEFFRNFGLAIDLSQITHINLSTIFSWSSGVTHAWETILDHMPQLSQIHVQAEQEWLEMFILRLWPETEPIDYDLSRRIKTIVFKGFGKDFEPDGMSELLIRRLQSRLHVVGSPLEKLVTNFTTDNMLERMDALVTDFVYNPGVES